ncbi:hypothetical protein ACFSC6_17085 [Rufibacter sediminis]|uniref:Uncharacterized protein n=1 Tax=Rufibacter sediminis TaxID=2762756 RepID=A0ABR6VVR5_9BACT|nr:hypothetical protein [Rufibacter sediminis]MBC3541035.1 hypothetical protein [Rufibacter sediminis]
MKKEETVLKVIYGLVKGDKSPVHLPISPVAVSEATGLALDQVQAFCETFENHGYLISNKVHRGSTYYYITKAGLDEAVNPTSPIYFTSSVVSQRRQRAS